ncbi:MAG: ABC transporter permease subunit [Elusimicrobiota bacterium]
MPFLPLDPLTRKKLARFRSLKRGWWSALGLAAAILLSCCSELMVNSRALAVRYEGRWRFPTYGAIIPGKEFGLDYDYETNYRKLAEIFRARGGSDIVVLPLVPYNPYENDLPEGVYPPTPPSRAQRHFLGTDTTGRDVLARLVYGFRTAIAFSLLLLLANYTVGVAIGCAMGYFGGLFDLFFQRLIEVWSNIPFLYVIIIVASIMIPNFFTLVGIMIFFGWISMTWYMRTAVYKQKSREYVLAARALGASDFYVIFCHILPNTISVIVTFIPFSVSGGIVALTSLDYLGFGLPPPTPSWGELLRQGTNHLDAVWMAASVVTAIST